MRANPVFRLTLLAAALAAAGHVHALGLGRLTVESSLGQPLSARIELTTASRDELDSLTARVADPSLYRQNNMQFQPALSRTRVTVEQSPGGAYLRVTSPTSVNEPFLDLVVEVSWASGRVVRSYTFLLDPPGVQVQTPVEPVTPARGTRTAAVPAPVAPAAQASAPSAQPGQEYQVRRGDTLSKIAADVKPPTVTLDQMLVALFKSNAGAFDGNNMNRLRSGAIITVPSADDAATTSAPEATRVVRVQASDWRGYRDRIAAAAPEAGGTQGRAAGGRIGAAVTEQTPAARAGGDQVRVASGRDGTGARSAAEDAVARDQQLREAQTRIAILEKTIADLQKAVQMRSAPMSQAQQQAEAAAGKTVPAPAPTTATKAPEPKAATTPITAAPPKAEPLKVEPPKAATTPAEPPKVEPAKTEPPKTDATPSEPPKAAVTPVEPPKAATKATPKVAEPPKAAPGFFEDLFANTPTWAIGGGALAILAGIAAIVAMRRRKTTKFEDSIISGTDIKTNTVFGSTGGGVVNTGDNSLASDFSREGLGNIDTDEVDPIAEAEVYLAYGRDAQAEEILKDALKKDPQRQEIYLKLLEIHAQHNKPSAFETVA
ncbi:MAG TPA: FimV/HubP family polar landmark protein, partial [Casimicrobiaceae bacterium]